jgi:hypothetical protein
MNNEDELVAAIDKYLSQMPIEEYARDDAEAVGHGSVKAAHASLVQSRRDAFHVVGGNRR